ncbi:MAG TPA: hypothetical protein VFX59_24165 [Polyangiales bacterium]|nr:hypothetical protein [Polyangiales bacterium]
MRNSVLITLALLAAYALGTVQASARADDSGKLVDLMRNLVDLHRDQRDALRTVARSSERCAK